MILCIHMARPLKEKRNKEIVRMREDNPTMSWTEIGEIFRIKKQTAFKIWKKIKDQEKNFDKKE
ncbi:hypothetical protein CVU83_03350 [Candidatus Falkowbacteria bacterium HGW-Falkowbacteria-2]|uniref:RNA polymerase sigma-70 region 4 domain-containing protein n=1 Tax=Candidatus Falkowbacteria bacterium HGW-Falkowbacteria-2 TaxID=2013769 RepID=A0A2N2DXF1_9BACT|nr:MAG: hypothetical protein CVU83_03350 [Candidatus Falkowbacteria bacterium HGW-Falkowbacteria-2]